jgi:anthranilate/para-aminobenzoate synthase component II
MNTKWQFYYNDIIWADVTEYKLKNEYLFNGYDNGTLKVNYHSIVIGNQQTATCLLIGDKTYFVNEVSSTAESSSYNRCFDAYRGSVIDR